MGRDRSGTLTAVQRGSTHTAAPNLLPNSAPMRSRSGMGEQTRRAEVLTTKAENTDLATDPGLERRYRCGQGTKRAEQQPEVGRTPCEQRRTVSRSDWSAGRAVSALLANDGCEAGCGVLADSRACRVIVAPLRKSFELGPGVRTLDLW